MSIWSRIKRWWTKEQDYPKNWDVNEKDDLARRAMYPNLTDEQYNEIFHKKP